jgi:hypothetical protein
MPTRAEQTEIKEAIYAYRVAGTMPMNSQYTILELSLLIR